MSQTPLSLQRLSIPHEVLTSIEGILSAIEEEVAEDFWILFDIDDTLITLREPDLIFQTKEGLRYFHQWFSRFSFVKREKILAKLFPYWDYQLIEEESVQVIEQIQERGHVVLACTAMSGYEVGGVHLGKWRIDQLQEVGLCFGKRLSSHYSSSFSVPHSPYSLFFQEGIFFNGWDIPKGPCLEKFFSQLDHLPQKIFFIDDKLSQLESVYHSFPDRSRLFLYRGGEREEREERGNLSHFSRQLAYFEQNGRWVHDWELIQEREGVPD